MLIDHQPFTVNSNACTLAVCHTLYCVAILFLAVHMHDALLRKVPILFSQCTSCFRKTMTLILFSTTNSEWLTEPKKKKKITKHFSSVYTSAKTWFIPYTYTFNGKAKYLLDHTHYTPLMFHDMQFSYDRKVLPILIMLSLWAHYLLLTL